MNKLSAFTLMELMVVVVIAAILFAASVPDSDAVTKEGARQFTEKLEADLSYARTLTIADPSDPTILKMDPDTNSYWLAKESAPNTPITNPATKKPYFVQTGKGSTAPGALKRLEIVATAFEGDQVLKFNSVGTLDQQTNAVVRVKIGDSVFDVDVNPQSTRVKIETKVDGLLVVESDGKLVAPTETTPK
ncbi:MAG: prepilin-type N-terminal cleavage/methylation domain-containing protein [Planctomycetes bacterium]|nr:prepilin-type N-terminal cleavage/methylation domain-containing protein [Planctomycetota bacterium]